MSRFVLCPARVVPSSLQCSDRYLESNGSNHGLGRSARADAEIAIRFRASFALEVVVQVSFRCFDCACEHNAAVTRGMQRGKVIVWGWSEYRSSMMKSSPCAHLFVAATFFCGCPRALVRGVAEILISDFLFDGVHCAMYRQNSDT